MFFSGIVIDPLAIDPLLPQPIAINQVGALYKANISMSSIYVHGLSGIRLSETHVTRSENLTDIDIKLAFAFDVLRINGSYFMKVSYYLQWSKYYIEPK